MSTPQLKAVPHQTAQQNSKTSNSLNKKTHSPVFSVQLKRKNRSNEIFIWNTKTPLMIGVPFQWSVELTPQNKILIRNLNTTHDTLLSDEHILLPLDAALQNPSKEYPLPGNGGFSLIFKLKHELKPAFIQQESNGKSIIGYEVFTLFGNIIQKSDPFYTNYTLQHKGKSLVRLQKLNEDNIQITNGTYELNYELNGSTHTLNPNGKATISNRDLKDLAILDQNWGWRISPLYKEHSHIPFSPLQISSDYLTKNEGAFLKKYSIIFSSIFAFLFLVLLLMPKPEVEEKPEEIPPQFAKIILQQKAIQKEVVSQTTERARTQKVQSQAQAAANQAAIKKTFRKKAVQNSLNKLIKGGMNRVLSESKILTTAPSNLAVGSHYSAPAKNIGNSLLDQVENSKILSVAAIGGASGAAGGGGAGYGTGTHAQVSGQGTGFIDLDFGNALISKGLTADEVGKVIHKHLREVQYCYESSMIRNPSVQGKLTLDFIIGTSGRVTTANVKQSNLNDTRLEDCIIKRLVTWPFPRPKGNVEVAISYPFILKALGR